MEWISGFGHDSDGRLCAQRQGASGHELLSTLAGLSSDLGVEDARPLQRTTIQLHRRTEVAVGEYLAGLGRPDLCETGQPVYAFSSSVGRLLIPAQLIVLAAVGQRQLRMELLSPEGPSSLMTVVIGDGGLRMEPTPCRNRGYDLQPRWNAPRLEWIQCYPSARAAWSSVYANALQGRLDISPIAARCSAKVRGILTGDGTVFVTSLKLVEVFPEEQPFEFALGFAATSFLFNSKLRAVRPKGGNGRARRKDVALEHVPWSGAMSAVQWSCIEPLLAVHLKLDQPGVRKRKYELRQLVDVMLAKTIAGVPWPQAHPDPKYVHAAIELFYRLTKAGVWDEVVATLINECRGVEQD